MAQVTGFLQSKWEIGIVFLVPSFSLAHTILGFCGHLGSELVGLLSFLVPLLLQINKKKYFCKRAYMI